MERVEQPALHQVQDLQGRVTGGCDEVVSRWVEGEGIHSCAVYWRKDGHQALAERPPEYSQSLRQVKRVNSTSASASGDWARMAIDKQGREPHMDFPGEWHNLWMGTKGRHWKTQGRETYSKRKDQMTLHLVPQCSAESWKRRGHIHTICCPLGGDLYGDRQAEDAEISLCPSPLPIQDSFSTKPTIYSGVPYSPRISIFSTLVVYPSVETLYRCSQWV